MSFTRFLFLYWPPIRLAKPHIQKRTDKTFTILPIILSRYDQRVDTFQLNRTSGTLEWACSPELRQLGSIPQAWCLKTPRSAIKTLCNSRLLRSHMRLRGRGRIFIGLRVRDTISRAVIPHTVRASSVRLRHGTTKSCYCIKASTKPLPLSRNKNVPMAKSLDTWNTRTSLKHGYKLKHTISFFYKTADLWSISVDQSKTSLISIWLCKLHSRN